MPVSLISQVRLLGPRKGFRVWRTLTSGNGVPVDRLPEARLFHGAKENLPAYRRK